MKDFIKHDGSSYCPVSLDSKIKVETWTPHDKIQLASQINWELVKWYQIIEDGKDK